MVKLYVPHAKGDCEVILPDGHLCAVRATLTMTRVDDSVMAICEKHAVELRRQRLAHPEIFEPVKWAQIH